MKILFPDEEKRIDTKSSIDQYRGFIATFERGGWAPIEFDFVDFIKCVDCKGGDKHAVVTHPVIIEFDDDIGYNFPIDECSYTTDEYLKFDRTGTELLPLPEGYGDGFYEAAKEGEEIIDSEDGVVGIRNNYHLKIGQDYYLATDLLPGDGE